MMFRDRGERQLAERLTQETGLYRSMATDLEAEDRLRAADGELLLAGRHLLTSNDRYQMTAAHLTLARNRTLLTNAITDNYTGQAGPDFRGDAFNYDTLSTFLVSNYRDIKTGIETADLVSSSLGFQATDEYISQFNTLNGSLQWPAAETVSRHFVSGGVAAVDTIMAYTMHHYDGMLASSTVPNDFKFHLKRRVQPMFAEADAKRRAIDRVTGGAVSAVSDSPMLGEVYEDMREAIRILDEVSVWITMPRLYEPLFTLRDPLDELRPERRRFDPGVLGTPATEAVVSRPRPSGKPFSAESLNTQPAPTPPAVSPRPFSPDVLEPPHPAPAIARPSRPFDPSAINPPAQPERRDTSRPFDPSTLDHNPTPESEE